jgi:hypothetical protein
VRGQGLGVKTDEPVYIGKGSGGGQRGRGVVACLFEGGRRWAVGCGFGCACRGGAWGSKGDEGLGQRRTSLCIDKGSGGSPRSDTGFVFVSLSCLCLGAILQYCRWTRHILLVAARLLACPPLLLLPCFFNLPVFACLPPKHPYGCPHLSTLLITSQLLIVPRPPPTFPNTHRLAAVRASIVIAKTNASP